MEEEEAENNLDRISDLPDDVLEHIISLIPYEEPCNITCVTSTPVTQCSSGWFINHQNRAPGRSSRTVGSRRVHIESIIRLVSTKWWDFWNRVTSRHEEGSIYAMSISTLRFVASCIINYSMEDRKKAYNCPQKLVFTCQGSGHILVATMGAYKNLHLDFSRGQDDGVNSVNWWGSLGLILSYLPCPCLNQTIIPPLLRSIRLTSVNLLSKVDIVPWLFFNMSELDTIEIRDSKGISDVNLSFEDNQQRQRTLPISTKKRSLSIIDCEVNSIKIAGCNLTTFRYRGRCPYMEISTMSIMRDIMLDIREGPIKMNDGLKNMIKILPCAEYESKNITMCQWTFEVAIRPQLHSKWPNFTFLEELWWIDRSMDEQNIDSLITFLKHCPKLQKLFVTIDPKCYYLTGGGRGRDRRERSKHKLNRQKGFSRLPNLWLVRMDGIEHEKDELLLADHIFKIAETTELTVLSASSTPYARRLVKVDPNPPRVVVKDDGSLILKADHIHMGI